jgi:hypothetical protein
VGKATTGWRIALFVLGVAFVVLVLAVATGQVVLP